MTPDDPTPTSPCVRAAVWPTLAYTDAPAALEHLAVLGFTVTADYRADHDDAVVTHAELRWPLGGGVMVSTVRPPQEGWELRPGVGASYIVAPDVDALFERAVAAGFEVVREPYDTDHGSHDCGLRDREGNLWFFGTYEGA